MREVLRWLAASPHWPRTLRQNFARVVSLLAILSENLIQEFALPYNNQLVRLEFAENKCAKSWHIGQVKDNSYVSETPMSPRTK